MAQLRRLMIILAGCLLTGGFAGEVSAQSRMDRDWDGRAWQERDWESDRGSGWRDRDGEREWRWRNRERDCYYETRRFRNRFGETVVRRYRVCEDEG